MRLRHLSIEALVLLALAACDTAGGLGTSGDSPYAPVGLAESGGVDGLTVGHRLMEAGEYELALEAYYRAAGTRGIDAEVLSSIGSANLRLGRLNQAEQVLRRATEMDETFPAAWNNLGVVLMEKGQYGEASRIFRLAFALDSGKSAEIRDNLRLSLAKLENPAYSSEEEEYRLMRPGPGIYRIQSSQEFP